MKLAEALSLIRQSPVAGDPFVVMLACAFSPLHLATFLAAHLQSGMSGRPVQIESGLYGSLADTLEQLRSSPADAAAVFMEWPDMDPRLGYRSLGGWGDIDMAAVNAALARLASAIHKKRPSQRLVVSLPTLSMPPGFHTVAWQASAAELAIEKSLSEFAAQVSLTPAVMVLNRQQLALSSPFLDRHDFRSELNAGFPYTLKHADILAQAAAGLLHTQPPKKGLISDLDDTMWRGIVGEEGSYGVAWDLAGHAQIHGLYQQMLQSLARQGVLIGIASKNNAEVAERALRRDDFVLKRDRIFPVEIHWSAKSGSVDRILKTWNIGADSVVFIDDSPMELEEVRAVHPEIECILFPKSDPAAIPAFLRRLRDLFGKPVLSPEDALRLESIRGGQQFLAGVGDQNLAEDFLASAQAIVTFDWRPSPEDTRILELVNKTNQFNLNGRRFTEAEWQTSNSRPDAFAITISYQDKFGPLGKVAVVHGRQEREHLEIDVWVMSCRAFSRRIEYQTLQHLFERFEVSQIHFAFAETPKNSPTADFFKSVSGDEKLAGNTTLTKAQFAAQCPTLYHQVAITSDDRELSWTTQKSD